MKMENEGRKIMNYRTFRASVTCVRTRLPRDRSAISAEFVAVTAELALRP